jgi:hypothetical protein
MRTRSLVALALLVLAGCYDKKTPDAPPPPSTPPDRIVVDHILIGVQGEKFPEGRRSRQDAEKFARGLLVSLKAGEDWAFAKRQHSEDPPPGGPYPMSNTGVRPNPGKTPRNGMVPAFGDVGFALRVDEIGLAEFDPVKSPFGFHLIKRVK